eukprot:TRINITY_DN10163_c0_g1_i25.p1 TRINITY_DN10163_c0_g1~~TRINITY_DN10163_c0_g1_i25.p1  ORF type:complete len:319 (+),score=26.51 TRINITY_DN10163_c0_g1_i25:235-1191(+)
MDKKDFSLDPNFKADPYLQHFANEEPEEENPTVSRGSLPSRLMPFSAKLKTPTMRMRRIRIEKRCKKKTNQIFRFTGHSTLPHGKKPEVLVLSCIIIDFLPHSIEEEDNRVQKPVKLLPQRLFQEQKRHSSVTMPSRSGTKSPLSSLAPGYVPPVHRDGISTPPPGLGYYFGPEPSYSFYVPYDTNGYAQSFSQPFPSYPNPVYPPVYMNYQGCYQQAHSSGGTPKKRSAKPSQFRPNMSSFGLKGSTFGTHNAENEEEIIAIINEFEEKEGDLSVLRGKVAKLVLTQTGSRFLQKLLPRSTPEFISFILQEVSRTNP